MRPFYIRLFLIVIICFLGIIIYSDTFHGSFHFDDRVYITHNPSIKNLSDIKAIWDYWPTRFLTSLSFSVNYSLNRLDVTGYHLVNISIHIISAILVFYLVLLTLLTPMMKEDGISRHAGLIAFSSASIFLTHPIQTQAVTYIVQRAASLATLFYLLTLIFYIKSRLSEEKPLYSSIYYISSLVTLILAMFTKEITITLPFMVLLYEAFFFKGDKRINLLKLMPFFIALIIIPLTMILTRFIYIPELRVSTESMTPISPLSYLFTQFRVIITYIRLLFLPINQNLDYDYPVLTSFMNLPALISLLLLVSIITLAIRVSKRYKLLSFGISWFFLALLPESSIIPIKDVIFEHRLYLPMVGFSIFLTSLIYYRFAVKSTKPMIIILITLITAYSMLTYSRNYIWQDDLRLWNDTVLKSPHKARPYIQRGNAYFDMDYVDKAIEDYTKAVGIDINCRDAYNDRAVAYFAKQEYDKSWGDVYRAKILGYKVNADFIENLKKASGIP